MMERRLFLKVGVGVLALLAVPKKLLAVNYREKLPALWKIKNNEKNSDDLKGVEEAIKTLFGTNETQEGKIKLKAPQIAENGAVVPIKVKAEGAKRIAIFQSANPEAAVCVFDVPELGIADYAFRIKMQQTGHVVAVAEIDGKLYKADQKVKVTVGGCGG